MKQPLFNKLRVLDLTKVFSGPFASRLLADYGAEVLKIEHVNHPDESRSFPPLKNGWSGYFELLNRNKKGLSLDLKTPKDLERFYALVQKADVIVENMTPSAKCHLKIDYPTLVKINPKIIYASLSGKGQDSDLKYYDLIAQAESGLISLTGTPKTAIKIGPSIVDAFSGMTLAFAISSALYYREKTGYGQFIDVSMLDCAYNLLENNLIDYSVTQKIPKRIQNQDTAIAPFGVFKTLNGQIAVAVGNDKLWQKLSDFLSTHTQFDWQLYSTNSKRLTHLPQLIRLLESVFTMYSSANLKKKLDGIGIPCSPLFDMSDVAKSSSSIEKHVHPKLGAYLIPKRFINFHGSKDTPFHKAPSIGQHNSNYGL